MIIVLKLIVKFEILGLNEIFLTTFFHHVYSKAC